MDFYPVAIEKLIEEFAKLPSSKVNITYIKFARRRGKRICRCIS